MNNYYVVSKYGTITGLSTRFVKSSVSGLIVHDSIEDAELSKIGEIRRLKDLTGGLAKVMIETVT